MSKKKSNKFKIKLLPLLKDSTVYYVKLLIFVVLLNFVYLTSFSSYFKKQLYVLFSSYLSSYVNDLSVAISLGLLIVIKISLYSIIIENKDKDVDNTFSLVLELLAIRFFPVLATTLAVAVASGFLALIFVVPGIIFLTYSIFAPIASAVRTEDKGTREGVSLVMGINAVVYSCSIVHNSFLRVFIFNVIVIAGLWGITQIPFLSYYTNSNGIDIIKHIVFDFLIVFNVVTMLALEKKIQKESDEMAGRYSKYHHFKWSY